MFWAQVTRPQTLLKQEVRSGILVVTPSLHKVSQNGYFIVGNPNLQASSPNEFEDDCDELLFSVPRADSSSSQIAVRCTSLH
jgi:hypothetical protein